MSDTSIAEINLNAATPPNRPEAEADKMRNSGFIDAGNDRVLAQGGPAVPGENAGAEFGAEYEQDSLAAAIDYDAITRLFPDKEAALTFMEQLHGALAAHNPEAFVEAVEAGVQSYGLNGGDLLSLFELMPAAAGAQIEELIKGGAFAGIAGIRGADEKKERDLRYAAGRNSQSAALYAMTVASSGEPIRVSNKNFENLKKIREIFEEKLDDLPPDASQEDIVEVLDLETKALLNTLGEDIARKNPSLTEQEVHERAVEQLHDALRNGVVSVDGLRAESTKAIVQEKLGLPPEEEDALFAQSIASVLAKDAVHQAYQLTAKNSMEALLGTTESIFGMLLDNGGEINPNDAFMLIVDAMHEKEQLSSDQVAIFQNILENGAATPEQLSALIESGVDENFVGMVADGAISSAEFSGVMQGTLAQGTAEMRDVFNVQLDRASESLASLYEIKEAMDGVAAAKDELKISLSDLANRQQALAEALEQIEIQSEAFSAKIEMAGDLVVPIYAGMNAGIISAVPSTEEKLGHWIGKKSDLEQELADIEAEILLKSNDLERQEAKFQGYTDVFAQVEGMGEGGLTALIEDTEMQVQFAELRLEAFDLQEVYMAGITESIAQGQAMDIEMLRDAISNVPDELILASAQMKTLATKMGVGVKLSEDGEVLERLDPFQDLVDQLEGMIAERNLDPTDSEELDMMLNDLKALRDRVYEAEEAGLCSAETNKVQTFNSAALIDFMNAAGSGDESVPEKTVPEKTVPEKTVSETPVLLGQNSVEDTVTIGTETPRTTGDLSGEYRVAAAPPPVVVEQAPVVQQDLASVMKATV